LPLAITIRINAMMKADRSAMAKKSPLPPGRLFGGRKKASGSIRWLSRSPALRLCVFQSWNVRAFDDMIRDRPFALRKTLIQIASIVRPCPDWVTRRHGKTKEQTLVCSIFPPRRPSLQTTIDPQADLRAPREWTATQSDTSLIPKPRQRHAKAPRRTTAGTKTRTSTHMNEQSKSVARRG